MANFLLLSLLFSMALSVPNFAAASSIGVCYGMVANDLPPSTEVINMFKSNQIGRMRLYDPKQEALEALRGSDIEVLVGVGNEDLQQLANSNSAAEKWVETNIKPYSQQVRFGYIAVGNEVIPGDLAGYVLPAMQNLQKALSSSSEDIKVSTAVASSVLGISYPPSAATFSQNAMQYMAPIAQYLNSIGAPLLANVYPYFAYIGNPSDIPLPYALFASKGAPVADGSLSYDNLFDAMVDALYAALEKAGGPGVPVVVSETGWPSVGNGNVTTADNAQTYNSNLITHVLSSRGTPRRPGNPIETYLFALFNENMKPGDAVEQHWGLFYPNKSPVYPINFQSGEGSNSKTNEGSNPKTEEGSSPKIEEGSNPNTTRLGEGSNPDTTWLDFSASSPRISILLSIVIILASFIMILTI